MPKGLPALLEQIYIGGSEMNFFKNLLETIGAWLASHPVVKGLIDGAVKTAVVAACTYTLAALKPEQSGTITAVGIGAAVLTALKIYGQHALEAFLLDQAGSTPKAALAAKRMNLAKMGLVVLFLSALMAGPVMAWDVPASSFALHNQKFSFTASNVEPYSENDIVLIPTASLGFGVGSGIPSYGYSAAYDLVFGKVTVGSAGVDHLSPYFGIGGAFYVDMGQWINSGLQLPVVADGGFNVLGPDIQGLVPMFELTWNFQTGEEKRIIGFTAPFDIADNLIIKLAGL
jgi:hypothetical protein